MRIIARRGAEADVLRPHAGREMSGAGPVHHGDAALGHDPAGEDPRRPTRELSVLSQPFPALYLEAKRRFYRSTWAGRRPGTCSATGSCEDPDEPAPSWTRFLARISQLGLPETSERVFEQMRGYSGQWTPVDDTDDPARAGIGHDAASRTLIRELEPAGWRHRRDAAGGRGSKEIRCEEFVPCTCSTSRVLLR